jgi:hypothetical protein
MSNIGSGAAAIGQTTRPLKKKPPAEWFETGH